ncbi:MAG: hypothetical protein WC795_01535 [Candidatus Paceibacterota bacterium]|jgi:Tfp pilus assembly protein PilW
MQLFNQKSKNASLGSSDPKSNCCRGATIFELLVYILIFSLTSIFVIDAVIVMTKSFAETRSNHDLLDGGLNALERMSREIRLAKSIDGSNSTLDVSPGVLFLNTTDDAGNTKTVEFYLNNGVLTLKENGAVSGVLVGQNISVTNLVFRQITTVQGSAIKVELTVQDTRGSAHRTEDFYDTIILRGDYQ